MTPIAFPFAHHTMPITGGKAYSEAVKVSYKRLPGFQEIKRNDVVVFNYPMEADEPFNRPIDKRENYIKRSVGLPGDVVSMERTKLFVNGEPAFDDEDFQTNYLARTGPNGLNSTAFGGFANRIRPLVYESDQRGLRDAHDTRGGRCDQKLVERGRI